MGGVNNNRDYATTMGFGDYNAKEGTVNVTKPLLQGGIVSIHLHFGVQGLYLHGVRSRSTTSQELSSVPSLEAGSAIGMDVSRQLRLPQCGLSLGQLFNALLRTATGCSAVMLNHLNFGLTSY